MQLGIFAKTFDGTDPGTVLTAAKAAGFATVQYNMACSGLAAMPDDITEAQAHAVASAAKLNGVSVCAVSGTYNMIHPDITVREKGLVRLEVLASRCKAMGTNIITLCTGTRDAGDQWRHHPDNATPEAWRDLCSEMEKAICAAEQSDLYLGIEPELANVVSSAQKAKQLIKEMGSDRLKIVLDAANLFEHTSLNEQHTIVASSIEMLAGHIAMAHAKDRSADGAFIAAGTGVLDYGHYLLCLKRAGFNGPLVTHGLSAAEAPGVAAFLRSTLDKLA